MDIQVNKIYKLEDGTEIVCLLKSDRYWVGVEIKPLKDSNKALLDFSTTKVFEIGKEAEGYLLEELREITE